MKLTIERKRWARANSGKGPSLLLNSYGNMCCLGFLAKACGHTDSEIDGISGPRGLFLQNGNTMFPEAIKSKAELGLSDGTREWSCDLIFINDDPTISEKTREDRITGLMLEAGVEVEFV